MAIKPYAPRHTTEDLGDTLRINIPIRKQWLQIIMTSFWLALWASFAFGITGSFITGQSFRESFPFMFLWLGGWLFGGVYVAFSLVWNLFGKEVIEVSYQSIVIKRALFGLGFPKEYAIEHIKAMRISRNTASNDMFGWSRMGHMYGLSGGLIAFDYGAKTIRFGSGIDAAEAKQIVIEIFQRFPNYRNRV